MAPPMARIVLAMVFVLSAGLQRPSSPRSASVVRRRANFFEEALAKLAAPRASSLAAEEAAALEACASEDRAAILDAVDRLERSAPTPSSLLDDGSTAARLDGRWSLVATVAGRSDDEAGALAATGVVNAVNASGIVVDSAAASKPVQEVRLDAGRIANEILVGLPVVGRVYVRVSGPFTRGSNGRRANVKFDSLEVFGPGGGRRLATGALFALIDKLKPDLVTGGDAASWLETTYLSDAVRVGRGNKGSVFVLARTDAPTPLRPAEF